MDWDWKDLGWDLVEWDEKDDSSLADVVSSCGLGGQESGGLMVDLKLGRISDTEQRSADALKDLGTSPMASSPSGSSKKTRVLNGTQNVSCLVDGCKSDLNMCREYHRRHRVCERHSKTPVVIVGGKEQRFCQQCSRFHCLGEFDEVKRSCRKRLDGHNMRRRKSQPESLYLSEKFLSDYKGPRILQFSSPQIYGTTTLKSARPVIPRSEAETMISKSHWRFPNAGGQSPPNSFAFIYNGENKMLSFLQENGPKVGNQAASEASVYQPLPNSIVSTESGRGNYNTLSSGLTQSIDLGCALYLLSSHQAQTSAMGLSHRLPSSVSNPIQSLDSGQQPLGVAQYSCSLIPEATDSNILYNGMFPGSFDALLES